MSVLIAPFYHDTVTLTLTSNFDPALGLAQLQEVKDPSDTAGSGLCCEGYDPDTSDKSTPLLNSTEVLQEVDGLWVIFPENSVVLAWRHVQRLEFSGKFKLLKTSISVGH